MVIQEKSREQLLAEIKTLQMEIEKLQETESKHCQIEKMLTESEAKYHSLFASMMNAFALHRMLYDENHRPVDYVFLEVNEAFERFTGLKRENVIGKKATEVLLGLANSEFDWIDVYGQVALTGNAITFEQYSEALGKWYHVSAYSPEKDCFVTIFIDLTENKNAQELRNMYMILSTYSRDIILYVRQSDGRILEANEAAVREYGFSRLELLGMTIYDLRQPDQSQPVDGQMKQANESGILFEGYHLRKDGSSFPVEVSS